MRGNPFRLDRRAGGLGRRPGRLAGGESTYGRSLDSIHRQARHELRQSGLYRVGIPDRRVRIEERVRLRRWYGSKQHWRLVKGSPLPLHERRLPHRRRLPQDSLSLGRIAPRPAADNRPGWRRRNLVPTPPPDWGDGWLEEQYAAGWGLRTIARAVGRSYTAVRRRLRRRGVAFRTAREAVRSRHPCCTREWLLVNYVARELSLTACARLAGVSKYTLTAWLKLAMRIRVRSASEQLMLHYSSR